MPFTWVSNYCCHNESGHGIINNGNNLRKENIYGKIR
jgi:hypothetical protein